MRIDLFVEADSLPLRINFKKTTGENYQKTLQVLLYYLLTQKGEDPIYPELGINYGALNQDIFIVRNELEMLERNLNLYGYNVKLGSINIHNNVLHMTWYIEEQKLDMSLDIGDFYKII